MINGAKGPSALKYKGGQNLESLCGAMKPEVFWGRGKRKLLPKPPRLIYSVSQRPRRSQSGLAGLGKELRSWAVGCVCHLISFAEDLDLWDKHRLDRVSRAGVLNATDLLL